VSAHPMEGGLWEWSSVLPFYEVDGQRGTINSSDLPEIPSGGFMKTALFQPSLPEPCRLLS
jgi:hypothetical protein